MTVHGDDFLVVADLDQIKWIEEQLKGGSCSRNAHPPVHTTKSCAIFRPPCAASLRPPPHSGTGSLVAGRFPHSRLPTSLPILSQQSWHKLHLLSCGASFHVMRSSFYWSSSVRPSFSVMNLFLITAYCSFGHLHMWLWVSGSFPHAGHTSHAILADLKRALHVHSPFMCIALNCHFCHCVSCPGSHQM